QQGALVNGSATDDDRPTLKGKADAGNTVTVYDNGQILGTVVVNAQGEWALTPAAPLAEGEHKLTVTATNKTGNTSPPSDEFVLITDYTPPAASDATLSDHVGAQQGPITNGDLTDDTTPT